MADPAYSNTGQPLPPPTQHAKATPRGNHGGGRGGVAERKLFPPIALNGGTKGSPVLGGGSCPTTAASSPNPLPDIGTGVGGEVRTSLTGTPLTTTSSRTSLHQLPPQSPTKLPTIAKKSSSISNLATLAGSVRRTTSLPTQGMRADLCRSPSCPQLWSRDFDDDDEFDDEDYDDYGGGVEYRVLQKGVSLDSRAMRSSRAPHKNMDSPTKLPSIFGGSVASSSRDRLKSGIRRSSSLQSRISSSLVDAPNIAGVGRPSPRLQRENATMSSSLSLSMGDAGFRDRQGTSPARRANNTTALLLPMRENGDNKLKRSGSKKRAANAAVAAVAAGNAPPGARQASEGTSGDSGVSVNYRPPSDHSDSSSTAQDGSETGVWEPEIEVEIDDETPEGRLRAQQEGSTPRVTPHSNKGSRLKGEVGATEREAEVADHRTALSAEKCREWLENVSEDGQTKTKASNREKQAFKMPKIN